MASRHREEVNALEPQLTTYSYQVLVNFHADSLDQASGHIQAVLRLSV